jgi:hypothetical protein
MSRYSALPPQAGEELDAYFPSGAMIGRASFHL